MATVHGLIEAYLEKEDKAILGKILEQLKTTKELWTVLVRVTKSFYLGAEHDKATAYLFTNKEYADNFVREVKWSGIEAKYLEVRPEQRISFFSDLCRSGFEAVCIDKGEDSLVLSLYGIIDKPVPDPTGQIIMNPTLVRAGNQFYQELAGKRAIKPMQDLMCREIYKAKLLVPVAAEEGKGRHVVEKGSEITFATLTAPEDKKYIPVFSDWNEFARYDKKKQYDAVVVEFADFSQLIEHVDGIALNPFGFNLLLDGEKIRSIEEEAR